MSPNKMMRLRNEKVMRTSDVCDAAQGEMTYYMQQIRALRSGGWEECKKAFPSNVVAGSQCAVLPSFRRGRWHLQKWGSCDVRAAVVWPRVER